MNKSLLLVLTFVGGAAIGIFGTKAYEAEMSKDVSHVPTPARSLATFYDRVFDDDFFAQNQAPIRQMQKMREEMARTFSEQPSFDSWFEGKFGGALSEIAQEEDKNFVYYRLGLNGIDKESVKIDVMGNQFTISGERSEVQAQEEGNEESQLEYYHSFRRSLPVPRGVDASKVSFRTEGDHIVIQFPKAIDKL